MSDHDPTYWAKLSRLVRAAMPAAPTLFDVGANRGDFTAAMLAEFPGASVHAIEANPYLVAPLEGRFHGAPVRVWHRALQEREGSVELEVHADSGTSSLFPRSTSTRRYFHRDDRVVEKVSVPAATLDGLAREAGIDSIALLKLDTQGAEVSILRGARALLAAAAIDVVYTEFFVVPHYQGAATLREIWEAFHEHGYVLFDLFKGPNATNGQLRFGDAIFVSPKVRERVLDAFPEEP